MKSGSRLFLWLGGVLGTLAMLSAVVLTIAVLYSRRSLETYRAELMARGEELSPTVWPTVPSGAPDNGGPAILNACKELCILTQNPRRPLPLGSAGKSVIGMILVAPEREGASFPAEPAPANLSLHIGQKERHGGKAEAMHKREAARTNDDKADVPWTTLARGVALQASSLNEIRNAAKLPTVQVDHQPSGGAIEFMPEAARYLSAESLLRLNSGDTASAVENIETQLRMVEVLSSIPMSFALHQALFVMESARVSTWEALQSEGITAEELRRLQRAWQATRLTSGLANAIRSERARTLEYYSLPETISHVSRMHLSNRGLPHGPQQFGLKIQADIWTGVWSGLFRFGDERMFLECTQACLDVIPSSEDGAIPWRELLTIVRAKEAALHEKMRLWPISFSYFSLRSERVEPLALTDTLRNMTLAAIAIRRYQLDHQGDLPSSLGTLVPDYLGEVPRDPLGDGELLYRVQEDGFLLYSVGLDGEDNGGTNAASLARIFRGSSRPKHEDVVWPQEAKP